MTRGRSGGPLPSVGDIRAWVAATEERPKASMAARAFGVRGIEDRRAFKHLYREALHGVGEGASPPNHDDDARPDGLPPVTLFRVLRSTRDGDVVAAPDKWERPEPAPEVTVLAGGGAGRLAPGTRLIARVERQGDRFVARPIRVLPDAGDQGPELAVVITDDRGRQSLKAARPGRALLWAIAGEPPAGLAEGDLALVRPMKPRPGPRGRDYRARILSVHGRADDPAAFGMAMLASMDAPIAFSEAAEAAARDAQPPTTTPDRQDLRKTPLLTIDGADARDFDDAVFAEPIGKGWRVIVAIADVASYVRPGEALDQEARTRGNSTYLPDRAIPMLPEALSNGLCSLKPGEDRACLFVEMTFDGAGKRTAAKFGRGLMRSHWRLTYEMAADVENVGETAEGDHVPAVLRLYTAFACLQKGREGRAPLELDLPERTVTFAPDGKAVAMGLRPGLSSHRLIEEFMVQANAAAAEALLTAGADALYRVHDKPDPERIGLLAETAGKLGAAAPGARLDRPRDLNALLARLDDPATSVILSELILRAQSRARYAADCDPHFGLALDAYAHFTSPIRRYADLVVHRALIQALGLGPGGSVEDIAALEDVAEQVNRTERRSATVERATLDRYSALFASLHIGETLDGRIVGVNRAGLFVRLNDPLIDGFAPAALLPDDHWRLSRDGLALEGRRGRKPYKVGDAVTTYIRDADPATGGVTLEIQGGGRSTASGSKGRSKGGKSPGKRFTRRRRK